MSGLPDLSTILALLLAGSVAVAGWFVRLWQGSKERERETNDRLQKAEDHRKREAAARVKADEQRKKTDEEIQQVRKEVKDGGTTDHFESDS